jgi:hypothetical protein
MWRALWLCGVIAILISRQAHAEVILQFFNNTWNEITDKMPEIAEVGYGSLWLPPPQKASGDLSVGYDLWDPFDLGGETQRTGGRTRYGTEEELLRLIETAHRFGIRVYFDNIMNHRAFDIPGYDEFTPVDIYPGMLPEDFHLRVTEDGFYRAWDDTVNWGNTWEVQNQFLSGLIDIAHETPNDNFGASLGSDHAKISFVRHPQNPEYYDFHPTLGHVGFGTTNITVALLSNSASFYSEDVGGYLMRSVRWLMDRTKVDGLRLDAVKHVPAYFFGDQWSAGKDTNAAGYCGQAQWQFNRTRGFSDANHRDTLFDTEKSRDDAMIFGEHMGEPPPYTDYFAAGMRLVDAKIHQTLNDNLGNSWGSLSGLQSDGYIANYQFGAYLGVPYAKSHDDGVAYHEELHNAINITRRGLPDVYTDGNRHAETLGDSGGAFPRHANTKPFGQFGDNRIPNLVYIHNHFARGDQVGKWGDGDILAFERRDKRENGAMSDADGTVLFMVINDHMTTGQYREIPTTFPNNAWLWQYGSAGPGFYYRVTNGQIRVTTPPDGYFAFSWRSPEESYLWKQTGGRAVTIYENGREPGWVSVERRDGPDGDPAFNPYAVSDTNKADYAYTYFVPRVASATNVDFVARVDGSAFNVLFKLDGGVPLNTNLHELGDARDNPPALSSDLFLGYEQAQFKHRIHREKFAARNTDSNNGIGSAGAETYTFTAGVSNFVINAGATNKDSDIETAQFVYHDPNAQTDHGFAQCWPRPEDAAGGDIYLWAKTGFTGDVNRVFVYYTTDGQTWPEGAGGVGRGVTQVKEMTWSFKTNGMDWWTTATPIPPVTNGAVFRYKISAYREQNGSAEAPWVVRFPNSTNDIAQKTSMMGVWLLTNVNAAATPFRPHNDYGMTATGLVEGFHTISARAYLQRDGVTNGNGKRAAIYNTFQQTFYLDTKTPEGEIKFPAEGATLWDNRYGVVVRTDPTVRDLWYNIQDLNTLNDDGSTGAAQGNGTNAAGQTAWVKATRVSPSVTLDSPYPVEWRFNYVNIPTNSAAAIRVKLAEISSSTNPLLSDVDGHFRTLTRNVTANGPDYSLYVGWPQHDGDTVGVPYTMKVYFSPALWNADETTIRNRFLIKIDGTAQGRDAYDLNWQSGPNGFHELAFDLPDLYNGDANYQHEIEITHTNAGGGGVTLYAGRLVKAAKSSQAASVIIQDPPEFDLDGAPYQIVLPDVASPTPEQRQYTIRVQTDLSAQSVWIAFTNSTGSTHPVAGTTNQLTGTVSVVQGSDAVAGTDTRFDEEVSSGSALRIGTNLLFVAQVSSPSNLTLMSAFPGATAGGVTAQRVTGNPLRIGNNLFWNFVWTNIAAQGTYTIVAQVDTNQNPATVEASATRAAHVVFRDSVPDDDVDYDDDDDGLFDAAELVSTNLPSTNPETWNNGQVHIWYVYGHSDPQMPDTDGDRLPDGLESGWRAADTSQTATNVDTNGDGFPNFRGDLDPPFFNTVPDNSDVPNYNFNDSRTKLIAGTMTSPNNSDSDGDGLQDGVEDANRNGWVDGDGLPLGPTDPKSARPNAGDWPDGKEQNWETWTETDPNQWDSDGDNAGDGYGEDKNFNGRIDGDANSNRVWNAGEQWQETDPLTSDTDGDGLPDGWEAQYGFDALDDGVIGHTNKRTGAPVATIQNGASGNPDGDFIVVGSSTNAYSNLLEFQNGTNPWQPDNGEESPGAIKIGRGLPIGAINGVTNYQEFTDWTADDCLALDEYEGGGPNYENGDVYPAWVDQGNGQWALDGYDTSRDLLAFYARDGGNADGKFYFRFDFYDLQANAEDVYQDLYIVIDTGQPGQGEVNLPDEVDLTTDMKWEAVVAVYKGSQGAVYVDADHVNNTTAAGQALDASVGVTRRDQNAAHGFIDAYYNAELDSVEVAISRQALFDAGWNGLNPETLNYQVFVTKDGTCNSCKAGKPGPGDIGGRNDVRDTIVDDYLAEDREDRQAGIQPILKSWIPGTSKAGVAKVASLVHGNQAIQPGSVMQRLVNDDAGAGYHRVLAIHDLYDQALNLHITPTLASAIEWAKADPALNKPWLDGPALNDRIATMIQSNLVALLATTFADPMLPYFTTAAVVDNEKLSREVLKEIYGVTITSNAVFWTPERLMDHDVLTKIGAMGYRATVLDQMEHLWRWFGRGDALGTRGYQINRLSGIQAFAINNGASDFRFDNDDKGLSMALRRLFNRKARGDQDQVVTLFSNREDFGNKVQADAYDANVRWIANHPWIRMVQLEDVLNGRIDLDHDGLGDNWYVQERGAVTNKAKCSHNYINYATQENFDNWYLGSAQEEGLQNKKFDIRPGVQLTNVYGMMYTPGIVAAAWNEVASIADSNLARLARATFHASTFESAFHNQGTVSLEKFSNGEYIQPDTTTNALAAFAKQAQAQSRMAAMYERVDDWAGTADDITNTQTSVEDVDLDAEDEYLLFNDRLFAAFERVGGRMVGAWVRDLAGGGVFQVIGNPASFAGTETEFEGDHNVETNGAIAAYRTSGLKDWFVNGSVQYVNELYTFASVPNGWRATSASGKVQKTVTLPSRGSSFEVGYLLSGDLAGQSLFVRSGLSVDLLNLLCRGQQSLGGEQYAGGVMTLLNTNYGSKVSAWIGYGDGAHNATVVTNAVDDKPGSGIDFATLRMRNQAQTHQVEVSGTTAFSFALGFRAEGADQDGDGIPNVVEDGLGLDPSDPSDGSDDDDLDGLSNSGEYIAGTSKSDAADYPRLSQAAKTSAAGLTVRFPTELRRDYSIWYANSGLMSPTWQLVSTNRIRGTGGIVEWTDDGSQTAPPPAQATNRFYRIQVELPQ